MAVKVEDMWQPPGLFFFCFSPSHTLLNAARLNQNTQPTSVVVAGLDNKKVNNEGRVAKKSDKSKRMTGAAQANNEGKGETKKDYHRDAGLGVVF